MNKAPEMMTETTSVAESGCFSQSVTQSPTAVTMKECQSLTITCRFQTGSWGSYDFQTGHFFKQARPAAERERISSGEKFVTSTNKGEMTFSLQILDLRVDDSATYYCQAEYSASHWQQVDGTGSTVTVTADSIAPPSQSPAQHSSPAGQTVTLSCKYSSFCPHTVHWYRQFPGQAPKFLLQRHTSGKQDKESAAGGRFSDSLDTDQTISRLTITKLLLSDSAVYHCALSPLTAQ
ncbi:T cell receptor alpha chain MC.7.G5-like [Pristis pectinata]|uniref:T cell receptor alpha chain MC.7.G5-like n=1 Tax=Pristis pectinata TaxID=685728 RepID=UPI00223CA557|nr:T cell receptor alpha chain MC.7.G5-like [Pristis pectinata]